jgi:hypothetical protein
MTQKLSELTSNPNLSTDDLLYVVDDAAGTPHSYKATIAAVLGLYDSSGLVPYSGATGAVNLGTNGLTVGAILPSSSGTQDIGSTSAKWRRNHFTEWHLGSSINEASISVHSQGILVYADTVIGPKFINTGVRMPSTHAYQWSNGTSFTGTSDVFLYRGGPGILQQRNGLNAQQFELFGQYTSATSFENLILKTTASAHQIGSGKGSAGGNNWPVQIGHFNSAGTFTSALSVATNGTITASGTLSYADGTIDARTSMNHALTLRATGAANAIRVLDGSGTTKWSVDAVGSMTIGTLGYISYPHATTIGDPNQIITGGGTGIGIHTSGSLFIATGGPASKFVIDTTGLIKASGQLIHMPPTSSITLSTNGQFSVEMTSNTNGNLVYRGSDGTTRRMAITFT